MQGECGRRAGTRLGASADLPGPQSQAAKPGGAAQRQRVPMESRRLPQVALDSSIARMPLPGAAMNFCQGASQPQIRSSSGTRHAAAAGVSQLRAQARTAVAFSSSACAAAKDGRARPGVSVGVSDQGAALHTAAARSGTRTPPRVRRPPGTQRARTGEGVGSRLGHHGGARGLAGRRAHRHLGAREGGGGHGRHGEEGGCKRQRLRSTGERAGGTPSGVPPAPGYGAVVKGRCSQGGLLAHPYFLQVSSTSSHNKPICDSCERGEPAAKHCTSRIAHSVTVTAQSQ